MKPSHRSFVCLMIFAFARLVGAQPAVPPAVGADTSTPWGLVSLLLAVGLLTGGFLIVKSIIDGRNSKASLQWLSVPGTVVFSRMVEFPCGESTGSRPEVRYSYMVNGQACQSSRVKFGNANSQEILAKYPLSNPVQVFFDPHKPSSAVLETGGSTRTILFAGIGTLVFCFLTALFVVTR